MATIVRVKRRRNEDPLDSIVISCKRKKQEKLQETSDHVEPQSSLKFAGTVSSKGEGVSSYIRDAIKKEKLRKEYKQHSVNFTSKNRQRQKQASQNGRLKIISSLRQIDLEELDKQDNTKCNNSQEKSDVEKSEDEIADRLKNPTIHENESRTISENESRTKSENESRTKGAHGNNTSISNVKTDTGTSNKVYQLLDVEIDQMSSLPTFESLLKESQSTDNITCNSVPLVRQTVPVKEEDFVYDLYYTNNQEFNFKALESDLTVQVYDDELIFADDRNFTNDEIYEDEDDSNDEDNWRNDYPDEDPHFYENDDAEYYYGDDVEYQEAFEHQDHNLADWMSSRCNIEDVDEAVSDDENGMSYDKYYQMIKKEMDELDDDVIPGD